MDSREMNDLATKVKGQYLYYVLVGIVSLLLLCFLPFLGTEIGLAFVLPDTVDGWIVFGISKLSMALCNVLIFSCFVKQARVNIKEDLQFKDALDRYNKGLSLDKSYKPKSPKEYFRGTYIMKGSTVFLTTLLGTIALTQAILTFDVVVFLTTVFSLIMAVVFGIISMKKVELYWTEEFVNYVNMYFEREVIINDNSQQETVSESDRADTEE